MSTPKFPPPLLGSGFPAPTIGLSPRSSKRNEKKEEPPPAGGLFIPPPPEDDSDDECDEGAMKGSEVLEKLKSGPFRSDPEKWTFIPNLDDDEDGLHDAGAEAARKKYSPLVDLLTRDPNFELAEAICVVAPTISSEAIIKPLVSVLISTCVVNHYMALRIERVVDETVDKATLFRSKTFTTVLLSVFAQQVGHSYMKQVVRPLIANICASPHSLEVDPMKAQEGEDTLQNTKHLISALEECFQYISKTLDRCPHSLVLGCQILYELVKAKFESNALSSVGGLFFLRFLCPALVNPAGVGLSIDGIGRTERRHLVLISKTIQSLSNGVEFGGKEEFMMGLNKFIREYRPKIKELLERLADGPQDEEQAEPQGIVEKDCFDMHVWFLEYKDKMMEELTTRGHESLRDELEKVLEGMGEPKEVLTESLELSSSLTDSTESPRARKKTNSPAWKTSELPPELAAALMEVELGGKSESGPAKPLYELEAPEKRKRRSSLRFSLKKKPSMARVKKTDSK